MPAAASALAPDTLTTAPSLLYVKYHKKVPTLYHLSRPACAAGGSLGPNPGLAYMAMKVLKAEMQWDAPGTRQQLEALGGVTDILLEQLAGQQRNCAGVAAHLLNAAGALLGLLWVDTLFIP
jgi:hypothetical protein